MPSVIFKIDPEKELEYLSFFESMASYRCTYDRLPQQWRKKIWDSGLGLHKKELVNLIVKEWEMVGSSGDKRKDNFKKKEQIWREYEKKYFDFIEKITGIKWRYDTYYNYGAVFSYPNYYNMEWERPEILTTVNDNNMPEVKIAHELFHSHQVEIFKKVLGKDYLDKVGDDLIETMLIFVFTEKGSPFKLDRNSLVEERKIYLDQDLQKYTDKLLDIWNTRNTIEDFITKAIEFE
jgi:hypothetical protein